MNASPGDPFDQAVELAELRKALQTTQRKLASAKAKSADLVAAVYEAAKEAALIVGRPGPIAAPKLAKAKAKRPAEVALVHTTDWQVGKKTVSYNSEVAADRIRLFASKVASLTEIQRSDHPVNHCCLLLGGDMVEGVTVFPGQVWEVDSGLFDQLFHTANMVESLVLYLLGQFQTVQVVCEYGNHGRIGRRGDTKTSDNVDRFVYEIARRGLASQPRLTWQESDDIVQNFTVGNYTGMLFHGDEIKGFGGQTPAFGIIKKVTAWASGVLEDFRDAYGGHFHTHTDFQLPNGNHIYMTGSPESGNVYAKEFVAALGLPSQRLHFVDPDAGRVTAQYKVWL